MWQQCSTCVEAIGTADSINRTNPTKTTQFANQKGKLTNFHEPSNDRQFQLTLSKKCLDLEKCGTSNTVFDFFVDLEVLAKFCPHFEQFDEQKSAEIQLFCKCHPDQGSWIEPQHFHAFLDAVYPSVYGIRPVPINLENVTPVLGVLGTLKCEPLLTNCERFLMNTNLSQLDGSMLIKLLENGMKSSLDHKILSRILIVCLMNPLKLSEFSSELTGNVGALYAQAFVANATRSFRHVKPIEEEKVCQAVRNLIMGNNSTGTNSENQRHPSKKRKSCDHAEESFECILCFDTRCKKCKGETSFCYKAIDNFLYEIRLQLFSSTYRAHLDRELLREDNINGYILRYELLPLPMHQ